MVTVDNTIIVQMPEEAETVKIILPKGWALTQAMTGSGDFVFECVSPEDKKILLRDNQVTRVKFQRSEGDEDAG